MSKGGSWHPSFKEGNASTSDRTHTDPPPPREARARGTWSTRWITRFSRIGDSLRKIATQLHFGRLPPSCISTRTAARILRKLVFTKNCSRWLPHLLHPRAEKRALASHEEILQQYESEGQGSLESVITVDETRVSFYNPLAKTEINQCKKRRERPPTVRCQS